MRGESHGRLDVPEVRQEQQREQSQNLHNPARTRFPTGVRYNGGGQRRDSEVHPEIVTKQEGMSRPLLKFGGGSGEILRDVRL